jgi:hypothetical protein
MSSARQRVVRASSVIAPAPGLKCAGNTRCANARLNCKIWYLISRTVSDDDAHCGDMMIARSALSPLSPRLRRAALCGFRLDRSARPSKSGDRAANALTAMLGNQGKRLSDNVREVECWFSHIILGHGVSLFGGEVEASNIPTIRRLIPSRRDHFRA